MGKGLIISEKLKSLPIIKEVDAENNLLNDSKAKEKLNLRLMLD